MMRKMTLRNRIRLVLSGFIIGLVLSDLTAFPLVWELHLLARWIAPFQDEFPALVAWIFKVRDGLVETDAKFPFLAYGTDWLAFAHLMIALAFIGPLRDPVRNRWLIEWGMICCVATWPLAFICGPIRGIPLGWILVDCAFGALALPFLFLCWKWTRELENRTQEQEAASAKAGKHGGISSSVIASDLK
jgi:hypothetical protein